MPSTPTERVARWSTEDRAADGPRAELLAAGLVPWRRTPGGGLEVLVIHRPRYDDWSWPKGKLDPGETLPQCAVRELCEEVGLALRPGIPLCVTEYEVSGKRGARLTKEVWYWAADAGAQRAVPDGDEVDEVRWVRPEEAEALLTNETDREPLELLVRADSRGRLRTLPLLVLRHAKAKPRSSWSRAEQERPLAATGRRQALAVEGLVAAWAPERLVSSPWRRCVETLAPLVKSSRLPLKTKGAFTETAAKEKPKKTRKAMHELLGRQRAQVVCTHRPVLPVLFDVVEDAAARRQERVLRAMPREDPWLRPGAVLVVHRSLDLDGDVVAVEAYDPWDD